MRSVADDPPHAHMRMIVSTLVPSNDDPADAPNFGPVDHAYLRSISHTGRRAQAIAARAALVDALQIRFPDELVHVHPWLIERSHFGAPTLRRPEPGPPPREPLHISLAHCDTLAVAALSNRRCGIDVEPRTRNIFTAWRRLATGRELASFDHLDPVAQHELAIRSWLLKEAWAKMCGDGLAHRAKQLSVFTDQGQWRVSAPQRVRAFIGIIGDHIIGTITENDDREPPNSPSTAHILWEPVPHEAEALNR